MDFWFAKSVKNSGRIEAKLFGFLIFVFLQIREFFLELNSKFLVWLHWRDFIPIL